MSTIRAIIFDAYGTLLNVHAAPLSQVWRQKQLEYTWLCALMDRYEDFQRVTEISLRTAAQATGTTLSEEEMQSMLSAYLRTPVFDDARPALEALNHLPLAILSNGTPAMLEAALGHNGIDNYFREIISVDEVKTYKPAPKVYALGPQRLGIRAADILFVSSNWWDAAGAKSFGYRVCWCNRQGGRFERPDLQPDYTISSLAEVPALVQVKS